MRFMRGVERGQRSWGQRSEVTGVRKAGESRVNGGQMGQRERLQGGGVVLGLNGNQWGYWVGVGSEVRGSKVRSHQGQKGRGGQGSMGVKGVKGKGYRTRNGDGVEWGLFLGLNRVRGHRVKGQGSGR